MTVPSQHTFTKGCSCGNEDVVLVADYVYFCPRQLCRVGWFTTDQLGRKSARVYMTEEETDNLLLGKITQQQIIEKERTRK